MSAGYDAEVAELFRDLRAASNLSETDLAARIATPVEVVQALEQGAIFALPPWPETARVVNAYGSLLNLDTRPLLRRIYAQIEAGVVELGPKPVPDVPVMPPQAGGADAGFGAAKTQAPPEPQARPQPAPRPSPQTAPGQPARQNGPASPQPQAPSWPGGPPQFPQAGVPGAQGRPQYERAPRAPAWQKGQPAVPPARMPAPDAAAYQEPPQIYPEDAAPLQDASVMAGDASLGADAMMDDDAAMVADTTTSDATFGGEPEVEPKRKRPALLKWGILALIASVGLVALWMAWMALGDSSDSSLSSGSFASDPVLDPDDPRSRKADRLPNNF
jgi:hypothetical protein